MTKRVSPIERVRADIDQLFASDRELGEVLEEVAHLGVRLLMQSALEAEVTEFLGRERYVRGERTREGSRNGHCATTIKTTSGPITLERPKLRDTDELFASRLLGTGVCRTNALESLVIASFVRGLSVRDVEAALAEALGAEAALSKSTVSRICEAIKDEFEAWRNRDLSGIALDYLFLDGSHFKFHPGAPAEPVLCAWGITNEGAPVLVGLAPGESESYDAWADFLSDLTGRGLVPPLLVVSDGAPGLIGACEVVLAKSLRQRCLIHRARNVLAKVPKAAQRRGEGRVLEALRRHRCRSRTDSRRRRARTDRCVREALRHRLPGGGQVPDHRRRQPDRLPALPEGALEARPPLQLHRAHLRRDPTPGQGHRTAAGRTQLSLPRLGRPRSRVSRVGAGSSTRRQPRDCSPTSGASSSSHPQSIVPPNDNEHREVETVTAVA